MSPPKVAARSSNVSADCQSCHGEIFRAWAQSDHAQAHRPVDAGADADAFQPTKSFALHGVAYQTGWENGRPTFSETHAGQPAHSYSAEFTLGYKPLRQSIVPIGGEVTLFGHTFELQLADPQMGILFLLAMSAVGVYGVMLAGWSSGSKYPLLGSVRASAQMISYEAALGMTVVMVVLITGSLSTRTIVDAQSHHLWQWNAIRLAVVPFLIFFIAVVAETNRPPFDLVEADQELVGGFHTEYSSIRFALFFLAEFMNTITMSAITVTLFFGGPDGPVPHIPHIEWIFPILWFLGKTIVFLFIFVWLRAALPRLRYDQLMDLGWKQLIPLSLGWLLIVAGFVIDGWWGVGMVAAVSVGAVLLKRAFAIGTEREATRAVVPQVGIRLWTRAQQDAHLPTPPTTPTEGGDR